MPATPCVPLGEVLCEDRDRHQVQLGVVYPTAGVAIAGRGLFERKALIGGSTKTQHLYRLRAGQLVYRKLTAWEGPITVAPARFDGVFVSSEFPTFTLDEAQIDPGYLRVLCRQPWLHREMKARVTGTAERRGRLNPSELLEIEVPVPELERQRLVAESDEAGKEVVGTLEAEASAALAVAAALHAKTSLTTTRVGDWAELDLEQVTVDPGSRYRMAGVLMHGGGLFPRDEIAGSETTYTRLHRLRSGRLVYRRLTAWEGPITVVDDCFDGTFVSPEFPTFKLDVERVRLDYVRFLSTQPAFHRAMRSGAKGTAERRNRLSAEDFLRLPVDLPSRTGQDDVGAAFRVHLELKREAQAARELAARLADRALILATADA